MLELDRDELLGRLNDEEVLQLAAEQERTVVTHNVRDFAPIACGWAEAGRIHSGLILVTFRHSAYGTILHGLEQAFGARPEQQDWIDRTAFLGHDRPSL